MMMSANDPTMKFFEMAINSLPDELITITKERLEIFFESPDLAATLIQASSKESQQQALLSLPVVLSTSEFISRALHQMPDLFFSLVSSDSVLKPRDQKDIRHEASKFYGSDKSVDQLMSELRDFRRREVVRVGWRDIAGLAPLEEVIKTLSCLADESIRIAVMKAHRETSQQYGEPIGTDSGKILELVVLALGKLGGKELNFSSDIDLIFTYPESGKTNGPTPISNHEFFIKVGQLLIRILEEITSDGFVFRTDMRLRPNGGSGPLALSFDAINHYYVTHGREWERFALIKARAITGDTEERKNILRILKPFVYRKYLDYGAFDALRAMKSSIERELRRKNSTGDIKRGPGGIREIEFIVQAHQLIRGGRELRLQTESLSRALNELENLHLIHETQATKLRIAYDFLRRTEHRLQAAEDLQTHQLPKYSLQRQQLAIASGFPSWIDFKLRIDAVLHSVHSSFLELFSPENGTSENDDFSEWLDIWQNTLQIDDLKNALIRKGFDEPDGVLSLMEGLRNSHFYHAFSRIGRDRLDSLMPAALAQCSNSQSPMTALTRLISVIESIGRRSAYLSLLSENPVALSQLIKLITASQSISSWISQHPVILDELLDPINNYRVQSNKAIKNEIWRKLNHHTPSDLEAIMDQLREYRQGYTLRLAAADIANIISQTDVSAALSSLAEALLAQSLESAATSLQLKPNDLNLDEIGIVAYGKLGSRELGYNSDLDLIFIFRPEIDLAEPDLYRRYNRLLQRLMHILTTRTRAGQLYAIDMRLRPDGRSGITINPMEHFVTYQLTKAQPWEHQALVRARVVIGSESFTTAFNNARKDVLCLPRNGSLLRQSVVSMRKKIIQANCRSNGTEYDLKFDHGGLLDVEFLLQYLILRWANQYPELATGTETETLIQALVDTKILEPRDGKLLGEVLENYLRAENNLKLQEKSALIPLEKFSHEKKWINKLWQLFLEPS